MKKYIISILTLLLVFALSGCGSNAKVDGVATSSESSAVSVLDQQKIIQDSENGTTFTLHIDLEKELDSSFSVEMSNFNLDVVECTISDITYSPVAFILDGDKGSTKGVDISGHFTQSCTILGYTFSAKQTVTQGADSKTEDFTFLYDYANPNAEDQEPVPTSGYAFYNATTPLNIREANSSYEIKVQLIENGYIADGKEVEMKPFSSSCGDITSYKVTTGKDGYARFSYRSPVALPLRCDAPLEIEFDNNGTKITQEIELEFNLLAESGAESAYSLINANDISIAYAGEIKEIAVQLVNDGIPQEGKEVIAKSIPVAYGTIKNVRVKTGTDGYARFIYVAPTSLEDGNTTLELLYDDNGISVVTTVTIEIEEKPLPLPNVVIPNDKEENNLTVNNELIELALKVYDENNAPYSNGKVSVVLPDKVIDGVDVGSFESYSVDIVNGIATFKYSGPSDLKALVNNGDTNSTFLFYHEANSEAKKTVVMIYNPNTDKYVPQNYTLSVLSEDGNMTMGLNEVKSFSIVLKDDQGNEVPDENITSFTITSKNTFVGQLLDADNNKVETLTIEGKNPTNFSIDTDTKSGLLPLDIVVEFVDLNGDTQTRSMTVNLVVFSGPATAMSISYVGVDQDKDSAKYIEKFAVTVTDAYNNPVNTQPYIAVGSMVEYAVDGSSTDGKRTTTSPRLWHGRTNDYHGTLNANDKTLETEDGKNIFQYVDFSNDKLVLFGAGYVYEALGKWDIQDSGDSDILTLDDDYYGETREDLYYAVGHNSRQDLCSDDATEYVGNMVSDTYRVNKQGTAYVEFSYDYHLTGKDIMVWVNLTGYQADTGINTRIGEARKHTLRGKGLSTELVTVNNGVDHQIVTVHVWHKNAPEYYRNGHFGYGIKTKCTINSIVDDSNNHDARSCNHEGTAYVDLDVSNDSGKDCVIELINLLVADEF